MQNPVIRVALTEAQVSALECRDAFDPGPQADPGDSFLAARLERRALVFAADERELVWQLINEASNAEDAFAQMPEHDPVLRRKAAGAAQALANLASAVLRAEA